MYLILYSVYNNKNYKDYILGKEATERYVIMIYVYTTRV